MRSIMVVKLAVVLGKLHGLGEPPGKTRLWNGREPCLYDHLLVMPLAICCHQPVAVQGHVSTVLLLVTEK